MGETIRDKLTERAREQDYESVRARLAEKFGDKATFRIINRPFEMLGGKTPAETLVHGTDEERYQLEAFITYAETDPWYLDTAETQQG